MHLSEVGSEFRVPGFEPKVTIFRVSLEIID